MIIKVISYRSEKVWIENTNHLDKLKGRDKDWNGGTSLVNRPVECYGQIRNYIVSRDVLGSETAILEVAVNGQTYGYHDYEIDFRERKIPELKAEVINLNGYKYIESFYSRFPNYAAIPKPNPRTLGVKKVWFILGAHFLLEGGYFYHRSELYIPNFHSRVKNKEFWQNWFNS